jgi:hypothetical protein
VPGLRGRQAVNALGAAATAVVLVLVLVTKFVHGAWIVVVAMPALFLLMKAISRHYTTVRDELRPAPGGVVLPSRVHGVVLVSKLHAPTLQALAYAKATRPHDLVALTVRTDPQETLDLRDEWAARGVPVDLVVLDSPYRDVSRPVLRYIRDLTQKSGAGSRDVVAVFIPEYVVGRWWEQLLHNQSALRLKARLLFVPGAMVISVPYLLQSSTARSRELAEKLDAVPPAGRRATTDRTAGGSRSDGPDDRIPATSSSR